MICNGLGHQAFIHPGVEAGLKGPGTARIYRRSEHSRTPDITNGDLRDPVVITIGTSRLALTGPLERYSRALRVSTRSNLSLI